MTKRLISGEDLMARWNCRPVHLFEKVIGGELAPQSKAGRLLMPAMYFEPDGYDAKGKPTTTGKIKTLGNDPPSELASWLEKYRSGEAGKIWDKAVFLMDDEERAKLDEDLVRAYYDMEDIKRVEKDYQIEPVIEEDASGTVTEIQSQKSAQKEYETSALPKTSHSVSWPNEFLKFTDFYRKEREKNPSASDTFIIRKARTKWRGLKKVPDRTIWNWIPKRKKSIE